MTAGRKPALSPSVNEAMIDRHFARDPRTRAIVPDATLHAIRDATERARTLAQKAGRVADAIHASEMLTVAARHRKARDETWGVVEPALRGVDAAERRARADRDRLDAETSAPPPPRDAMGSILAGEIRTRLAAMSDRERRAALATALSDGDDVVMGAVLNAPPMLSGLTGREHHDMIRAQWRQARHPEALDRIARIDRALEDLERVGAKVIAYTSSLYSSDIVAGAETQERAVAAALSDEE
ncbi:MAG: hypothetical protein K5872_20885 [Rhizobiaceae bacterium]|nr:hypothetical protein [Rhizobiaceae bacterium]MCV0408674.1 hypothetical protein [Rhizobiaceae bacterium]